MEWAPNATYTVMFTDLVDSTAQRARIGDNAADELQHEHHALLRARVEQHDGLVVKTMGDGVMAAFLSAADGLECAVAVQQAIHDRNLAAVEPVHVRIGLSLGDGRYENDDLNGTPVVEAARLCAAAGGGEILCADVVRAVAGSRATQRFTTVGALTLKGLPDPVPTVRVEWEPLQSTRRDGPPFPSGLEVGARIPFIGRRRELDTMLAHWRRATEGQRSVVLLSGEPGIGKTRLAAELARRVHAQGATVLYGRCDDELGVPYQPFVEALDFVIDHYDPEQFTAAFGRHAGELTRLVPGLAAHLADDPKPVSTDPETSQFRLFEAVAGALRGGSEPRPVLLVVDDLHWAAKPTLLLLRHVVASTNPARLMIVGTYRDTDLHRAQSLADVLADLRRLDGVERISLSGLDAGQVVELLTRIAGHELDESGLALAAMIYDETEGNPLFTGEVLRHLRDTGAIYEHDGRWVASGDVTAIGIPDGVREVIGRRLDRLSTSTNDALQTAAVIGRSFDLAVLAPLVDRDRDDLLDDLDEALDARLLYETGVARYAFAHALVRSALYDELRPTRRAHMHERVADAIERAYADDLDAHLGELAYHYARSIGSGNVDRAVEFACRAGERALAQLAHDEAVSWFEQARDLVDVGGADRRHLARILLGLGTAEKYTGQPTFRETLLASADAAQSHGDLTVLVQAALANSRGFWSSFGNVDKERVELTRTAIAAAAVTSPAERAQLLANLATEVVFAESLAARRAMCDDALAVARETGDEATLAHVLISRCVALWHPTTLDERLEHGVELAGLVESLGDPHLAYFTNWYRYAALLECGDVDDADAVLTRCGELAGSLGPTMPVWIQTFTRAGRAALAGDHALAERLAEEQLAVGTRGGQPDAALFYGVLLYVVRLQQGRLREIADLVEQAVDGPGAAHGLDALWGITACEVGRDDVARAVLDRLARDDFAHLPEHQTWSSIVWGASIIAVHLGDRVRAERCYELLRPYDGHLVYNGLVAFDSVGSTLGMLASFLGRVDAAETHLARAAALEGAIGAVDFLARTRARQHGILTLPRDESRD